MARCRSPLTCPSTAGYSQQMDTPSSRGILSRMTSARETQTVRELGELLEAGRLQDSLGAPFPVDPNSRHAGFPPWPEDCTPVDPLVIRPLRRSIEQPATPFGPARAEFVEVAPPLSVVAQRAVEYCLACIGFEWAVTFEVWVGGSCLATFFGNQWGWRLDTSSSS